jgi:CBS domain-containing protein
MRVNDLMQREPRVVTPGTTLARAGRLMAEAGCGFLPVVGEEEEVVGVLTDRDVCLAVTSRNRLPAEIEVRQVMSGEAWTCQADEELGEALHVMAGRRVRRLPVIDRETRLVGILSLDDVLAEGRFGEPGQPTFGELVATLRAICGHAVPVLVR